MDIPYRVDVRQQAGTGRPWRKVHLDYHNTPAVGAVGDGFDAEEFVATLKSGHVEAVVVFAKDMHGYFYYPAKRSEAVHPGLSRDLMGEQLEACRAAGIKVYTYYCVTWDHLLAEQHPDWLVIKRDRTSHLPKFDETPGWTGLCLRNPDFVRLLLDDSTDLVQRYPMDGVWYDMPFPIGGECYCHLCLAALREQGLDPLDEEVQHADKQRLWVDWQRRSAELVESLRPGCEVDQNNNTRLGLGERAPYLSNIDIEALPTGGWGYHYFDIDVRYARTFGVPVCGMTGRFHRSWADFGGLKERGQLQLEVARIIAQGAQLCVGDQAPPSARLDPAVYATIGSAYQRIEELQAELAGAAPVVEAAIIAAGPVLADPGRITDRRSPATEDTRWADGVTGMAELLIDHRVQFDVVEPDAHLAAYRLLVLPDHTTVTPDLASALQDHLTRGGAVIAAGNALQVGAEAWPDGVHYAGASPYSVEYLVPDAGLINSRDFGYALYGAAGRYRVDDADVILGRIAEPIFERTPEHYTSHSYSPAGPVTGYPAAWTSGRFGAVAFSLGADHLQTGYWVYGQLFGRLLELVLPDRLITGDLPPQLEVSITRRRHADGDHTLLHLVPQYTRRRWGTRDDLYGPQPVLHDLSLSIAADGVPSRGGIQARLLGGGPQPRIRIEAGRIGIEVPRLDGPDIIVLS